MAYKKLVYEMITKHPIPWFAKWRWKTLRDCMKAVQPYIGSLEALIRVEWFKDYKEKSVLVHLNVLFNGNNGWFYKFRFVLWLSDGIMDLANWGSDAAAMNQN